MQLVHVRHGVLHVQDTGDGSSSTPVVLIHALGTDLRLWDALLAQWPLTQRVVRFDLRGHGLSSCPPGPYTLDALIDDTVELLEQLDVRQAIIVGISLGGLIAQGVAAQRSDLTRALVLSNSAARMGDPALWSERIRQLQDHGMEAYSETILERWFVPGWGQGTERAGWQHMLERTPLNGYIGCCQAIADADLQASTAELTLPTLAIAGERDRACTPEQVAATAALVPDSRYACINGAAHLPCIDALPDYSARLVPFIREHSS